MRIDSKKKTVVGRSYLIFNIFQEINLYKILFLCLNYLG